MTHYVDCSTAELDYQSPRRPFLLTDLMLLWNRRDNRNVAGPRTQKNLLRVTKDGHSFAYAQRVGKQRTIAFCRIATAWPGRNNKTAWKDYLRAISKGYVPFPEANECFRPTLDWALTKPRFEAFLKIRKDLKQ